ncbi:uncharacterized protein MKK02DRAFT_45903 [Dioszegia hungarica]|uniref:Transmembrane protein n=1 Tax=Dioszegia hungarica TaxID=4972 RepID=A0AA38HBF4_9TREE|nr:uncharacterized protein MKK02DRAFT_45903 [Dioszegia hungarica]KAI9637191.1 hypothetical protein MKK02DRAFT_45903 [Dioszegia hungarica]
MLLILISLLAAPTSIAQSTNAICNRNETTSWLFNADGESPCLAWSKLQSLCLPAQSNINVPPLQDASWGYNPPSSTEKDSLCQCTVVAYALMAGCSWCQIGSSASWVTEKRWRQDCAAYNDTSVSFAQIVLTLPAYAFHPWQDARWNPIVALDASRGPTTVAPTVATTTLFRSFPPGSSTPHSPASSNPASTATDGSPGSTMSQSARLGAIIGGVAGGIILLVLIFLLFRYWRKRHDFDEAAQTRQKGFMSISSEGGYGRGEPAGLPFPDPDTPRPEQQGSAGFFGSLAGKKGEDRSRISRWSETFFTNPRKAPKPISKGYATTTQRLRHKVTSFASTATSRTDRSSFDITHERGVAASGLASARSLQGGGWDRDPHRERGMSIQVPERASMKPSPLRHPFALSPGYEPGSPRYVAAASPLNPSHQIVSRPPPRESFADRWSDQSSVFTFATSKTRETLPSFSTSVKDIKDHRTALAKKAAGSEAAARKRDDERWRMEKDLPPPPSGERLDSASTSPEIVLGQQASVKDLKKKTRSKSKSRGGDVVDESGDKKKKKKKKKRSSHTPSPKRSSTIDTPSASVKMPVAHPAVRKLSKIAHTRRPSDVSEYIHKPLPPPPGAILLQPDPLSPRFAGGHPGASVDFSVAPPRTPTSMISPRTQPARHRDSLALPSRHLSAPFSANSLANARMTTITVDFPSPSAYTSRPASTLPLTPRLGRGRGLNKARRRTTEFSDGRLSPHPTLPSLYEPKTGAELYMPDTPPALPPDKGLRAGRRGERQ